MTTTRGERVMIAFIWLVGALLYGIAGILGLLLVSGAMFGQLSGVAALVMLALAVGFGWFGWYLMHLTRL